MPKRQRAQKEPIVAVDTQDEQAVDETSANGTDSTDLSKIQADFGFRGPILMRMQCEELAAGEKLPLTSWLRKTVANAIGYALPVEKSVRGMTEAEKAAALQKAKEDAAAERKLVKQLLNQNRTEKGIAPDKTAPAATETPSA